MFDASETLSSMLNADQRGGVAGGKQSLTIDQAANNLTHGEPGWSYQLGVPATVTYAFRASAATMRCSRSTACAEGRSLPGGFLRMTYFLFGVTSW